MNPNKERGKETKINLFSVLFVVLGITEYP